MLYHPNFVKTALSNQSKWLSILDSTFFYLYKTPKSQFKVNTGHLGNINNMIIENAKEPI